MVGRFSRRSPLYKFYAAARKAGFPKPTAKAEAIRKAELYERLLENKKQGLTAKSALLSSRKEQLFGQIVQKLKEINPTYVISETEAAIIPLFHHRLNGNLALHQKGKYSLDECIEDYAHVRFEMGRSVPRNPHQIAFFLREMAAKRELPVSKMFRQNLRYGAKFSQSRSLLPGSTKRDILDFFLRVRAEGTFHSPENMRNGIRMWVNFYLMERDFYLEPIFKRAIANLRRPPTANFIKETERVVEGFSKKPDALKERIIQERRAAAMADEIAHIVSTGCQSQIDYEQEALQRIENDKDPMRFSKSKKQTKKPHIFSKRLPRNWAVYGRNLLDIEAKDLRVEVAFNKWVLELVKKSKNRRILIQLAMEWAAK